MLYISIQSTLFSPAPEGSTRGDRYEVGHEHVQKDICKRSFSVQCVEQWNRLPDVLEENYKSFKNKLAVAFD